MNLFPDYNNIEKWIDWFRRQSTALRYVLAFFVGLIVGAYGYHLVVVYELFDIRAQPTKSVPDTIRVRPYIATFGNEWPRTNMGTELNIFSDGKFLNRSSVSYETIKYPQADDYFLRIHFSLERSARSLIGDAYCGVYFEWTEPPPIPIDASSYMGLRFRASYSLGANKTKPRFIMNVATIGMPNFEYHEYDFSKHLSTPHEFQTVEIPFNLLRVPAWAASPETKRIFDSSRMFRISIVIKGTNQSGYLDIDDITFVTKSQE